MQMSYPTADPGSSAALRAVFKSADKDMRQKLVPMLPPEIVSFAGIRMYVDPRDNYTDRMIWRDGVPPENRCLAALSALVAGRNTVVFDVGANSGAYTLPLARAAGAGSKVIAIEPNPTMIGRLGHNLRLNDLGAIVRIESCALGACAGEEMLYFRSRNHGQASLLPIRERVRDGATLVPVRTLLEFWHEAVAFDRVVLKIDVEGTEDRVLAPLLDADVALPHAILMETAHADAWARPLVRDLLRANYAITFEAEKNTLFVRDVG